MIRPPLASLSILAILVAAPAVRSDDDFLKVSLAREIVGKKQSLTDVQAFTASRVPKMPAVATEAEWRKVAQSLRSETLSKVVFRGEAAGWRQAKSRVEWLETIEGGEGYKIKKLRFEAIPGLWIPALLYEPDELKGKVPVMLNVNGHDGKGKAADYKQLRCINLAKRGILALNVEWFGMGQLAKMGFGHGLINAIDVSGASGIALHFLSMAHGLDVLLAHEHADPGRVGVTGLSGGGWQTIFISSLDDRVTLTNPVAGYSSFATKIQNLSDLGDSEQTPCDLATVVDYAHLTAMMAPHPTLLTFNAKDNCCFAAPHALPPLLDAAGPVFKLFGKGKNLRSHVNETPGDHNYGLDNRQALYHMIGDFWFASDNCYVREEIPSEKEVKTADQLRVDLPADNLDFQKIAVALSRDQPRESAFPTEKDQAEAWMRARREAVRRVVRPIEGESNGEQLTEDLKDGIKATLYKVRVANDWTVPAVELAKQDSKGTALLIADKGRQEMAERAGKLLEGGMRVVAFDVYEFGESKVETHAYLWDLLIGAVGQRPLGVQAGQIMALARLTKEYRGDGPVKLVAVGPRSSTIALTAAALEEAIAEVELHDPLGSLKEPIEQGKEFAQNPELYCFGLLEVVDIPQLAALVAPRPVVVRSPSTRAKAEFGRLKAWYTVLGHEFDPIP
jgi:dienelactone hydrolase